MKVSKEARAEAIEKLKEWIKPGDTVYTILDHVSRSGMQRHIRILVPYVRHQYLTKKGWLDMPKGVTDMLDVETRHVPDFVHPNYSASVALGWPQATRNGHRQDAIKVDGCGMDMGFHLVYTLGQVMFPRSECKNHKERTGPGSPEKCCGGYALTARWL